MSDSGKTIGIRLERVRSMQCPGCERELDVSELAPFTEIECPDCGQAAAVCARLGNFRLLRLIGMGGMGGVYHAVDESLGRDVAIKVMLKSLGDDVDFVETFRREAQAAAQLNHPNIAQIYSFGQEQGQPYIVMELISGKRLDRMMEQQGALDQAFMVQVINDIAQGLSAAGDIGLIHGDIKPENILFDEKGQAKLVDFGLASFVNQQVAGGVWGTPYYIAPEKVRRQKVDARADIYSLGATFYHAITGKPPFEGKTPVEVVKARLKALPPPPSNVNKGVASRVSDIVMRMLQTSPTRRYPTYASLIGDLKRAAEDLPAARNFAATKTFKRRMKSKRRTTGLVPSADSVENGSPAPSTRIIISKTSGAGESPLSEYNPLRESPEQIQAQTRKRNVVLGSILGILLFGALGIGGIYGYTKYQDMVELRKLRLAYLGKQNTATQMFTEVCEGIDTIQNHAEKCAPILQAVTNDINAIVASVLKSPPREETNYRTINADLQQNVRAIRDRARQVQRYRNRVELILKDMRASLDLAEADERIAKIQDTIKEIRDAVELCEQKLELITAQAAAIHAIRAKVVEGREAAAEAAEKEKRRQEEEAKRRAEHEQAQREVEAEVGRANAAVASVENLYKTGDYARAIDILRKENNALNAQPAKNIIKPNLDRLDHLIDLRKGLTMMLAAHPLKWGWIQDGSPVDVTGASPDGVQIKGGRTVPWSQVNTRQMLKFVQRYADISTGGSKTRAKRLLEAAVFCHVNGGTEFARKYADRAIETSSVLEADVRLLIPQE